MQFGANGPIFYRCYCVVKMAGEVPMLDYVNPIYHRTEVSAHGPMFYRGQLVGRKGSIFYGPKDNAHEPIFNPIFFVYDKESVRVRQA